MKRATLALVLLAGCLVGCSEGGIGGTGAIVNPDPPLSVGGSGNKGPFAPGTTVTVTAVTGDRATATASTTGRFGAYEILLEAGEASRIDIEGNWFSESQGVVQSDTVKLSGITVGTSDQVHNVNVATHLIHARVLELISDGQAPIVAIDSAQAELTLALATLVPSPANPVRFADLIVVNASQATINEEGNAWLLAVTAIVEQRALQLANQADIPLGEAVQALLDDLATVFASEGTLPANELAGLVAARAAVNPDQVHSNLLGVDPELSNGILGELAMVDAAQSSMFDCRAFASDIVCLEGAELPSGVPFDDLLPDGDRASASTAPLEAVVADMNRFVDSDGDGVVNIDDDDDDNDGVPDEADSSPYGH